MGDPVTPKFADGKALRARAAAGPLRVLGVMSGTSMDAVDVKLLTTDGEDVIERGQAVAGDISDAEKAVIRAAEPDARAAPEIDHRTPAISEAERMINYLHAGTIKGWLKHYGEPVDLVGWHGQTIMHAPERRVTMQLGDAQALADDLGLPVVSDFRRADVLAGGEGAPLVPVYHRALVRSAGIAEPVLMLNLGGVANISYIDGDTLIACDTGPANALIDDAMAEVGARYDRNGEVAARGRIDQAALAELMSHPYFDRPAPKSLDRNAFSAAPVAGLGFEDRIATLTRFTVDTVVRAVQAMPKRPASIFAFGGGLSNDTLIGWLEEALATPLEFDPRFIADEIEAEAFAYLAVRSLKGLPISFPKTTGVPEPMTGGRLTLPSAAPSAAS